VYDKKMLWRANLFIDEGVDDWNNLNPWITGNEWNYAYDGSTRLTLGANDTHYNGVNYANFNPPWNVTTAPNNTYSNYVRPIPENGAPTPQLVNNSFVTIGTESFFKYLSGRCTPPDPGYWVNALSAGVDCVGLIQTAAGYDGNNYTWADIDWRHYPNDSGTWGNGNTKG
jgi:hypothetical protein